MQYCAMFCICIARNCVFLSFSLGWFGQRYWFVFRRMNGLKFELYVISMYLLWVVKLTVSYADMPMMTYIRHTYVCMLGAGISVS